MHFFKKKRNHWENKSILQHFYSCSVQKPMFTSYWLNFWASYSQVDCNSPHFCLLFKHFFSFSWKQINSKHVYGIMSVFVVCFNSWSLFTNWNLILTSATPDGLKLELILNFVIETVSCKPRKWFSRKNLKPWNLCKVTSRPTWLFPALSSALRQNLNFSSWLMDWSKGFPISGMLFNQPSNANRKSLSSLINFDLYFRISPENSVISSNFKAEFSQSLKELLHQELWMHNHLTNLSEHSSVPKSTGIFHYFISTWKLIMVTSSPIGEEKKPLPNSCCQNSNIVIQQPEKKVPLPFLGRSQSLLNIPLDLNRQLTVVEPKVAVVQQPVPATIIPQSSSRRSRTTPTTGGNTKRNCNKPDTKYQSLPHSACVKEGHKQNRRDVASHTMPMRSKSVEAKSASAQQHQYDISQLELFATIHQSRQAVNTRSNSKNLTGKIISI